MLSKSTMVLLAGAVVLNNALAVERGEAGNTVEKKEADKLSITPIDQTKPFFKTSLFWPNDPAIAKGEWRGAKGYPYHISAAYDGRRTIVVVAHVRTDEGFPDYAPGHVAVRRSTDFGGTWTRPEVIQPYIDWNLTASGLVYVPKHDQFIGLLFSMIKHKNGATPEKRRWIVGDKNGTEWSVLPGASRGEPQHLFVGNSQGASLRLRTGPHAGRLLIPLRHYLRTPDGKYPSRGQGNVVLYSDDHGATWQLGEPFALGVGSELGMAETSDGRLYGTLRNHGKKHWPTPRTVAHSNDGGRTWTDVGPGGPYNTTWTNGDVETYPKRLLPAGRERLMIFVNPTDDGPNRRPNHAVWFSYDDGASWPLYKIIWDIRNKEQAEGSGSGQQQLMVLGDGSILSMSCVGTSAYKPVDRGLRYWRYNIAYIEDTDKRGSGRVHHRQMDLCSGAGKKSAIVRSSSARYRFDAPGGKAKIRVRYFDAKNGSARFRLYVAGRKVAAWEAEADDHAWHEHETEAVEVARDDLIMLTGHRDGKDAARFDWIETVMP